MNRREFLAAGSLVIAAASRPGRAAPNEWDAGEVVHILPAASHERFLIKVSLRVGHMADVMLRVSGRRVAGVRSDTEGRFWRFDVTGLRPATEHVLSIEHRGRRLCGEWPLKTFPRPDASPDSFRLLAFTCAGGHEAQRGPDGAEVFRPMEIRRRLLDRGMSFKPQAVIANGDHVYWDQRSGYDALNAGWAKASRDLYARFAPLDRALPMLGTRNETAIKQLADPQIAQMYGVTLRSVPTFFLGDDHDYFENDEANEQRVTFPPDDFMVRARRAVQCLYYPEMLPDATRPSAMSGTQPNGLSENFGTLRYGTLFEALLYDCGRWLDLKARPVGSCPRKWRTGWSHERQRTIRIISYTYPARRQAGPPASGASGIPTWRPRAASGRTRPAGRRPSIRSTRRPRQPIARSTCGRRVGLLSISG